MRSATAPRRLATSAMCLFAVILGACACGGEKPITEVEPNVVKGTVRDTNGQPLSGISVYAYDALENFAYVIGISDAKGEYRIKLDPKRVTAYYVTAEMTKEWDGQEWTLKLHPSDERPFPSDEGALRDLTWRLTGKMPGAGHYGGTVKVMPDLALFDLDFERVEIDFVPSGPRIDGSEGERFTLRMGESVDLEDVAIGRYTVTARDIGENPVALKLRVYDTGDYAPSIETGFVSHGAFADMTLEISSN